MSGLTADGVRMMLYANPYLTPPLPGGTPDGGWLFEQVGRRLARTHNMLGINSCNKTGRYSML